MAMRLAGRRGVVIATALIAVLVAAVAARSASPGGASHRWVMSNHGGVPLSVPKAERDHLKAVGLPGADGIPIHRLGRAGPVTFYRAGATTCFATAARSHPLRFTSAFCGARFPSSAQPVIVRLGTTGNAEAHRGPVVTAVGLAADPVVTVELRNGSGGTLETAAVRRNLFWLGPSPAAAVRSFVALDRRGDVVFSLSMSRHPAPHD